MGLYLEVEGPKHAKMKFLEDNAEFVGYANEPMVRYDDVSSDKKIICLVDNGPFYAAAVAYDANEMSHFMQPGDTRKKYWFVIENDKIKDKCPMWDTYID